MSFGCPKYLELFRVDIRGQFGDLTNGCLLIPHKGLKVIFSDGMGWRHVSVSRRSRTPSYEDMDWIKQQFWSDDECVMQLHVPKSEHINHHPYCLHLWQPINGTIPRPPAILVGPAK